MEHKIIVEESSEDKRSSSCSSKNRAGIGKDKHLTPLECKLDSDPPSVSDSEQLKRTRSCSHLHQPCSCTIQPKSVDFTSTSKSSASISADFGSDFLHIFCRRSSLSSIQKLKTFRQRRRVKSVPSLTDLLAECSPVALSGNLILGSSTRWILDSLEATLRTKTHTKSSVICRSGPQITDMKRIMLRDTKSTKLIIPHPGPLDTASRKQMPVSCSSSNSASSSDSSVVFNLAFLHCVCENGRSYFLFTMGEDRGDVYIATPHKIKSSVDKALDYIYVFNAWKDKGKNPKKLVRNVHNRVGKMVVRSSMILNSSRSKYLETQFVLSAANEDSSSGELQSFSPTNTRTTRPYSKISEIFKRNYHVKTSASSYPFEQPPEFRGSEHGIIDGPGCKNFELAAIVVQDFGFESRHGASSGGWGLKFLEKAGTGDADHSLQVAPFTSAPCKGDFVESKNSDRHVSVLVPATVHGSPMTGDGGPSSLIERWRSAGHCDCGGWDLGCTLTVLNNKSKRLLRVETQDNSKYLNLSKEGAKNGESAFRMFSLSKDMHLICFQSTLSPLQSFSTGVALIHSQTPDLYPIW